MTTSRLDNVLHRNRKNAILDILLVAFILVAVLFTGIAFGEELPKLGSEPVTAATDTAPDGALAAADTAPVRLARR